MEFYKFGLVVMKGLLIVDDIFNIENIGGGVY